MSNIHILQQNFKTAPVLPTPGQCSIGRRIIMDDFNNQLEQFSNRVLSKSLTIEEETGYTESLFESIRHVNEYGQEFWYARELQSALEYKEWRNFNKVIEKAKIACESSENITSEHFVDVNKTINMPKNATKSVEDYQLSRYACYLIVQNGDPRKKVIALGSRCQRCRCRNLS